MIMSSKTLVAIISMVMGMIVGQIIIQLFILK
jgi:hypothetical protein